MDASEQTPQSTHTRQFPAVFWLLLALTAVVRLGGITRPLLGNFATRNVGYGMIARNWVEGRASLWYPTLDVLKGGQRSLIMLEFPVSAYLTAGLWRTFGGSLDVWGRATAVAFSVASVALMFLFVRRRHGQTAATAAALALALSPASIIYGQSFMLEASLVFFTLATFYTLDRWLHGRRLAWLTVAGACLALLLLTKIYMLVVLLPLAVMVLRPVVGGDSVGDEIVGGDSVGDGNHDIPRSPTELLPAESPTESPPTEGHSRGPRAWRLALIAAVLAVLPAAGWYAHAAHTASPEGPLAGRIFYSVRHSATAHRPPHPLLRSADFYRQVLDDLSGVVLTPVGFMLAMAGLLDRRWRRYSAWLLAAAVLGLALPRKFHEMNYYYLAVLPPLCILAGLGWQVIHQRVRPGRTSVAVLLLAAVLFSLRYSVKPAFVTPEQDRRVVAAAEAVRELTAQSEPVVTMHGTTIDLLYYCDRPGWALAPDTENLEMVLDDCRRHGARYLVVVGSKVSALTAPVTDDEGFHIYRLSSNR